MSLFEYCCKSFAFRLSALCSALYVVFSFVAVGIGSSRGGGIIGSNFNGYSRGYYGYTDVFQGAVRVFFESLVVTSPLWIISLALCIYFFKKD